MARSVSDLARLWVSVPFTGDTVHASHDPDYAQRFGQVPLSADGVFELLPHQLPGQIEPGALLLRELRARSHTLTHLSGRPPHPRRVPNLPDAVCCEAYSQEASSGGVWPGGDPANGAAFYAYPAPEGFKVEPVHPKRAFFHAGCGACPLPCDATWEAYDPGRALLDFFPSTYPAAAIGGRSHGAPERECGACGFRVHALDSRFSGA